MEAIAIIVILLLCLVPLCSIASEPGEAQARQDLDPEVFRKAFGEDE